MADNPEAVSAGPSSDGSQLIKGLYAALDRHDGEAMAKLYDPQGRFRDPAFGELSGAEAGEMWRMLTDRATDLEVELAEHAVQDGAGTAHWVATYTFSTGRRVVNEVQARFAFRDGRITDHVDTFSLFRWARQALGPAGFVLGLPPFSLFLRRRARRDLAEFRARPGEAG